ncbi:hypothetical protein [Stieleria magnilauensis]|uniref:hypothetical protein n=1 Tax=Stieleria magnilauensis TaxID=2527963 RepID=UPI003AF84E08
MLLENRLHVAHKIHFRRQGLDGWKEDQSDSKKHFLHRFPTGRLSHVLFFSLPAYGGESSEVAEGGQNHFNRNPPVDASES